jgi:UDP-N-acetylglucosamine/UDP-N-acetylgalactosamine diphosphorylase
MNIDVKFQKAQLILNKFDQTHLLKFYDKLSIEDKNRLLDQILNIDFELMASLYKNTTKGNSYESIKDNITPIKSCAWESLSIEEKNNLHTLGMRLLASGKVAAVTVAGGQGTRLGHNGPKGTFSIGLPSGKSLFQLLCERLINLSEKNSKYIPWYIMTSEENHSTTINFFIRNDYFGYPKEDIFFFMQGQLPLIGEDGHILLSSPASINLGPNGNGGCFLALSESGALKDMRRRGIEWIQLCGIDNAAARIADPNFIGFTAASGKEAANKVVKKVSPDENIGVLCNKNNRPAVLEYFEVPKEIGHKTDKDGELLFGDGNIVNHVFALDFLEEKSKAALPYHAAHKKVNTIDEEGNISVADKPNSYKFELFMFDIFPLLEDIAALRVCREEEFTPVKNLKGIDSAESAKSMLMNLHKQWLIKAGVPSALIGDKLCEISPLRSYCGENLDADALIKFLHQTIEDNINIE